MVRQFDSGLEVADVYAAALFELAQEAGTVDVVWDELAELVRLHEADAAFAAFIDSWAVDDDDRERSLEKIFRGRLGDMVLNTLQVMNRHDRAGLLPQLLRAFVLRVEVARGQVEVVATSAVTLTDAERAEIAKVAASLAGKTPLVEYVVDAGIIGGLVLQVGDYRLDNSIRRQLLTARDRLYERGNQGLEVGSE